MFGMSGEHLLILGIVLLIFGPRRLPELGNTLGRGIRNFKDAISGVEEAKFRKLEEDEAKLQAKQGASTPAQTQAPQKVESLSPLSASMNSTNSTQSEPVNVGQSGTIA